MRLEKLSLWHPESWQLKPSTQLPTYSSQNELQEVVRLLSTSPALVSINEIENLKSELAKAAIGETFLLQAGDCAESFADCEFSITQEKVNFIHLLTNTLATTLTKPIIPVGRIAGQYAKPRTIPLETQQGEMLPAYRGDMINRITATIHDRTPDPQRMTKGYECAAAIMGHLKQCSQKIFTSHEALLLFYEQAFTRLQPQSNHWYNLATHFPWVGERTAIADHAHIEYLRGIANPVGIKIGPTFNLEHLKQMIYLLDPDNIPGKLTVIYRLGANQIAQRLPVLLQFMQTIHKQVVWCCDPMHGNTEVYHHKKIRRVETILDEVKTALHIHTQYGIPLGGIHMEATHEDVVECLDEDNSVTQNYKTLLDPRLNRRQALKVLEVCFKK